MTHAQSTSNILMVRPSTFRKNEETAGNNHYQRDSDAENVHEAALEEFDGMLFLTFSGESDDSWSSSGNFFQCLVFWMRRKT